MTKIVNSHLISEITKPVEAKLQMLIDSKLLTLPPDYDWRNAIRFAIEVIKDTKDKDGKKVLDVCTPNSIQEALYRTVIEGLNPAKKQCYYIVRGTKLCCDRSYFGSIMLAKRVAGLKKINPVIIYKGDVPNFAYEVSPDDGSIRIIQHKLNINNQNDQDIVGAYAVTVLEDGTKQVHLKTIEEIMKAWGQGAQKGQGKTHENFKAEMAKKTVIQLACKVLINSSPDAYFTSTEDADADQEEGLSEEKYSEYTFEDYEQDPTDVSQPQSTMQANKAQSAAEVQEPVVVSEDPQVVATQTQPGRKMANDVNKEDSPY